MNQVIGVSDCDLFPKVGARIAFQRLLAPMMGRQTDAGDDRRRPARRPRLPGPSSTACSATTRSWPARRCRWRT